MVTIAGLHTYRACKHLGSSIRPKLRPKLRKDIPEKELHIINTFNQSRKLPLLNQYTIHNLTNLALM